MARILTNAKDTAGLEHERVEDQIISGDHSFELHKLQYTGQSEPKNVLCCTLEKLFIWSSRQETVVYPNLGPVFCDNCCYPRIILYCWSLLFITSKTLNYALQFFAGLTKVYASVIVQLSYNLASSITNINRCESTNQVLYTNFQCELCKIGVRAPTKFFCHL